MANSFDVKCVFEDAHAEWKPPFILHHKYKARFDIKNPFKYYIVTNEQGKHMRVPRHWFVILKGEYWNGKD